MSEHAAKLDDLAPPEPVTVRAGGEAVAVQPLTIGQLPAVVRALRGIDLVWGDDSSGPDIMGLVAEHGDAIIGAVALALGRPREWAAELPLDEFTELARAIIEVNADFFVKRVLPLLGDMARLVPAAPHPTQATPGST